MFVQWVIFNLLFPRLTKASFTPGISSSIGVLSSSNFPTEAAPNLPLNGVSVASPDCGWIYAAVGSTAPGFFSVPNFGTFNLGIGNIGQSNVGYNNVGFGNYGTNNTGRLNNGQENIGYLNDGQGNMGALNYGSFQIGDNNQASNPALPCIGYNNAACSAVIGTDSSQSTYAIGSDLQGSFLIGSNSTGSYLIGQDNTGQNSIGFQNSNGSTNGNIGVLNVGDGLVGYNNTGTAIIGQDNSGVALIGLENFGSYNIGYNNTGLLEIGFNQTGNENIGVNNTGTLLIGFSLTGTNSTNGTFIDTSDISLSPPIIFDPTDTVVSENIGTNFNSASQNETRPGVNNPFITSIDAAWQFNLDYPAILTVVDLGCPGDVIQVYDQLIPIMITTFPSLYTPINCTGLSDAEAALADPNYSRNFITLQPGGHLLTFSLVNSNSGSLLAFRLDSILPPPPCDECEIPVPPLEQFDSRTVLNDLPPFALPPDIHLPNKDCCNDDSKSNITSNSESVTGSSNSESESGSSNNESESGSSNSESESGSSNSESDSNSSSTHNTSSITDNASLKNGTASAPLNVPPKNNKNDPWCRSKKFQMLRNSYVTHSEALGHCLLGLANPITPGDQLEITSLLFQCQPTPSPSKSDISGGQWIGSDWNGRKGDCLVARGDRVLRAKNCNSKRRFICKLFQ